MNKIYNDSEENSSKLLEELKKLPKINAPENFEFNLMMRIQNKSFDLKDGKIHQFNLARFLAPSAVVVTVVLLFFVFYPRSEQINNLQMSQQKVLAPQAVQETTLPTSTKDMAAVSHSVIEKAGGAKVTNEKSEPVQVQQQIVPQQFKAGRTDFLQNNKNAISLDDYISGDNSSERNIQQGSVVNSGTQTPEFDGFLVKQKTDPKTLKHYREVVDSLKKVQMKLDSLKKASNLP
jgi:hypothetical protein